MRVSGAQYDLVALVADRNAEAALQGIFGRFRALQVRSFTWRSFVHPERDPGTYRRGAEFLRPFVGQANHALVVFDHKGCGREDLPRIELESELEERLHASGWGNRAAVICLDPELETWVWSPSPEVPSTLGWPGRRKPAAP